MGELEHRPASLTQEALVAVLEDILAGVRSGDTLEGHIEFLMGDDPARWDVVARYRVGNTMGQGGMRMIGPLVERKRPRPRREP